MERSGGWRATAPGGGRQTSESECGPGPVLESSMQAPRTSSCYWEGLGVVRTELCKLTLMESMAPFPRTMPPFPRTMPDTWFSYRP